MPTTLLQKNERETTNTNIFSSIRATGNQNLIESLIKEIVLSVLQDPAMGTNHSEWLNNASEISSESQGESLPEEVCQVNSPCGVEDTVVANAPRGRPSRDLSKYEIVRPRDLPFLTGLSRTSCWRQSKDPSSGFPPKIRLSAGAVGYSKKAIELWLKSREEV